MNTYGIVLRGYDGHQINYIAETPGKAKYQCYLEYRDGYACFGDFLGNIEAVTLVHKFRISDLFEDQERFQRTMDARGIPFAYLGMRVKVRDRKGTIIGSNSGQNLYVCFDGSYHRSNCHPWSEITYYDDTGEVVSEFH